MKRVNLVLLAAILVAAVLAISTAAGAQTLPRCMGGCDAEYLTTYDPSAMWATYGYPTYYGGCWWYDVGEDWWYMCPNGTTEPNSLYVY